MGELIYKLAILSDLPFGDIREKLTKSTLYPSEVYDFYIAMGRFPSTDEEAWSKAIGGVRMLVTLLQQQDSEMKRKDIQLLNKWCEDQIKRDIETRKQRKSVLWRNVKEWWSSYCFLLIVNLQNKNSLHEVWMRLNPELEKTTTYAGTRLAIAGNNFLIACLKTIS